MTKRTRWVIGNWKMNGSLAANAALLQAISAAQSPTASAVAVAVCAPFPYLTQMQRALSATAVRYGGQDVSQHASGAYTGQVSAGMLSEFGASLALVGHSERRQYNRETNDEVAAKAAALVAAGLTAVICVGETLAERESGNAEKVVSAQLGPCADVIRSGAGKVVVAYEPVWAIGTGKTATAGEAQAMHAFIRNEMTRLGADATGISVLYGGSVKSGNAAELFAQPDIDGGLIGGAALVASEFLAIVLAAH
jgi:triosephosphate isomerase